MPCRGEVGHDLSSGADMSHSRQRDAGVERAGVSNELRDAPGPALEMLNEVGQPKLAGELHGGAFVLLVGRLTDDLVTADHAPDDVVTSLVTGLRQQYRGSEH